MTIRLRRQRPKIESASFKLIKSFVFFIIRVNRFEIIETFFGNTRIATFFASASVATTFVTRFTSYMAAFAVNAFTRPAFEAFLSLPNTLCANMGSVTTSVKVNIRIPHISLTLYPFFSIARTNDTSLSPTIPASTNTRVALKAQFTFTTITMRNWVTMFVTRST